MYISRKEVLLIFSGYNVRAIISFLRTLSLNKIENYAIVALTEHDIIFQTLYRKKVIYTRKNEQLNLDEFCSLAEYICQKKKVDKILILPSTEALNRFILHYRARLEEHHCIIPLVDESLYIKISDKEEFCKLCKEYSLPLPKEITINNHYERPFVAKPRKYLSHSGQSLSPILVQNKKEYQVFAQNYCIDDYILQEFINGESYYLLYYFSISGKVFCLSQKNLIQQPDGKSIIAACCSKMHQTEQIATNYQNMFQQEGFKGLVMVELRKNGEDYYMIEANPRLWGPSQLFCDCGYNFFEYFLHDYHFLNDIPERQINYKAKYFWSGGITESSIKKKECVWHTDCDDIFNHCREQFLESDLYCREDTMKIYEYELERTR